MKLLLRQIFKFGITGFINTFIDFAVFNLLVALTAVRGGWLLGLINILAILPAAANSFYLNRTWTFRASEQHRRQLGRFIIASGIGMLLNSMITVGISSLAPIFDIPFFAVLNLGKIIGGLVSAAWNFIAYRHWVFRAQAQPESMDVPEPVQDMLSIVIPAYNESKRLTNRINNLAADIVGCSYPVEIIIVDDGSRDNTLELSGQLSKEYPFIRCLNHPVNKGKGASVRTGILAARGDYLVFTDADNTFSFDHISEILEALKNGHHMVVGQREGNSERLKGESWLRRSMGKIFNLYVRAVLLPGLADTQCGLKGFRREPGRRIFGMQKVNRFAFDAEILSLARQLNYNIKAVTISAVDCSGSTVNPWLAPVQMFVDIIRIRAALFLNLYGLKNYRSFKLEMGLAAALFTAALAFRIPWLWQVPRYIDELQEVSIAFNIYLGHAFPLHNAARDMGALHNYILAGLFKIFGPSIFLPRFYVAVTSSLTVILVYYLGRKLYSRQVGILAAGLLLTNGMHIMVTHMAWGNCTTPLFFVSALLATINAQNRKSGVWLIIAACLWAATLQTHSSAVIYILVAGIYVLSPRFRSEAQLTAGWYLGSLMAFLAAYSNMIYYNIISGWGSFSWVGQKGYALETDFGIRSFLQNLAEMSVELLRTLSSTYSGHANLWQYFLHPLFVLSLVVLVIGIRQAFKQREYLLFSFIAAGFAVIPWINQRYTFFLATRYIMPQVICSIILVAAALVSAWNKYRCRIRYPRLITNIAAVMIIMAICLQPWPFYNYCRQASKTNESNRSALQVMSIVRSASAEKVLILLDGELPLPNRPLPVLMALSRHNYAMLPGLSGSANIVTADLYKALEQSMDSEVIAVLSQSSYNRLKSKLPVAETYALSTIVTIPKPSVVPDTIYIIKLIRPNSELTSTGKTN